MGNSSTPAPQANTIKIVVLVLVVWLAAFLGFLVYNALKFHIVSTSPSLSAITTGTPFVTVTFNRPVSGGPLGVSGTPGLVQKFSVQDKSVVIYFNYPLDANKTYSIQMSSIYSTNGGTIPDKTFTFKPQAVTSESLPDAQKQRIASDEDKNQGPSNDPIMSHLPYGTLDFKLSGMVSSDQTGKPFLLLQAQLLLSHADMSDQNAAVAQYKKEVTDYITSLGLDPAKYTINYTVVTPS